MPSASTSVPSGIEHERLAFELLQVRARGQYLTRLRSLSREERSEWDRRERAAQAILVDHDLEHGCSR
jgi:hypothetical protein